MKAKLLILLGLVILGLGLPLKALAWGGDLHQYLCPEKLSGNCGIADELSFKKSYPFGGVWHLCLDNKPDCPPRLVAKYYVKKYFQEGKKDLNLLFAAAHLIQDSYVPDHWFPMRDFAGRIFVPFAPSWVGKTEGEVSRKITEGNPSWQIQRFYRGETIVLNGPSLEKVKKEVGETISREPAENLESLAAQIKIRDFWQKVRSLREWAYLWLIIIVPLLGWQFWHFKKTRKGKTDLLIEGSFLLLALAILLLGFFY